MWTYYQILTIVVFRSASHRDDYVAGILDSEANAFFIGNMKTLTLTNWRFVRRRRVFAQSLRIFSSRLVLGYYSSWDEVYRIYGE